MPNFAQSIIEDEYHSPFSYISESESEESELEFSTANSNLSEKEIHSIQSVQPLSSSQLSEQCMTPLSMSSCINPDDASLSHLSEYYKRCKINVHTPSVSKKGFHYKTNNKNEQIGQQPDGLDINRTDNYLFFDTESFDHDDNWWISKDYYISDKLNEDELSIEFEYHVSPQFIDYGVCV